MARVWRDSVPLPEALGRRDAALRGRGAGSGRPTPAVGGLWLWGGGAW
ncbi:hypothetical protein [Nonomuraea jabiensis]